MRVDDYLSTVGLIKRRTVAKEMADNGLVEANGRKVKPSYEVKVGDIIAIKGSRPFTIEITLIPHGSVARQARADYYRSVA